MRELSLKVERLTELSSDDLASVAGGAKETLQLECYVYIRTFQACTTAMSCGCHYTWDCEQTYNCA